MKRWWRMSVALALALVVSGWWLFRPDRLFVDTVVDEALAGREEVPAEVTQDARPLAVIAEGQFHPVHHMGSGRAAAYRRPDGSRFLRLEDFRTDNGPDLYVWLVALEDASDDDAVKRAEYVSLGRLKGNVGDQNYELPAEADPGRYRTVVIWCRRFGVNFAAAPLRPTS